MADNARTLADDWDGVRDVIYDQQTASHHDIAAALANVDNYISWIFFRFQSYEFCAVPPGAPLPDDLNDYWPDP